MKTIAVIFLLALLAVSARWAQGSTCTEETCTSTVAVVQSYNSSDCTGNYSLSSFINYTNPCQQDSSTSTSTRSTCSKAVGFKQTIFSDPAGSCPTPTIATVSTTSRIGVCATLQDGTSQSYWCSAAEADASTPIVLSKPADLAVPITPYDYSRVCNDESCTDAYGTVRWYDNRACSGTPIAVVPPSALSPNYPVLEIGKCYQDNQTLSLSPVRYNIKASCEDEVFTVSYYNGGCSERADVVYSYPRDSCASLYGNWIQIRCKPHTNAASFVSVAPLLVALAIISALLL